MRGQKKRRLLGNQEECNHFSNTNKISELINLKERKVHLAYSFRGSCPWLW